MHIREGELNHRPNTLDPLDLKSVSCCRRRSDVGRFPFQWGSKLQESNKAFTVVVDGPNVAYARQNFEGGGFSFHQIDLCVTELLARGEVVMVLLPHKYLQAKIPNHAKFAGDAVKGPVAQHEVRLVRPGFNP